MLTGRKDHRLANCPGTAFFCYMILIFLGEIFEGGQCRLGTGCTESAEGGRGNGFSEFLDGFDVLHPSLTAGDFG